MSKVALDGIHSGRRRVIEFLAARPGGHSTARISGDCRLPETTVRRHLQDLMAHAVVEFLGNFPERWSASEWLLDSWWATGESNTAGPAR